MLVFTSRRMSYCLIHLKRSIRVGAQIASTQKPLFSRKFEYSWPLAWPLFLDLQFSLSVKSNCYLLDKVRNTVLLGWEKMCNETSSVRDSLLTPICLLMNLFYTVYFSDKLVTIWPLFKNCEYSVTLIFPKIWVLTLIDRNPYRSF